MYLGNPIPPQNFDEDVLRQIGDTILSFRFGSNIINTWPRTLTHLPRLQQLDVTAGNFSLMPNEAFHGFEGTLKELTINNTRLTSVPLAVARVRYLETFNFNDNHNVGDYGMHIPIVPGLMPYLFNVSLKDDNITEFPLVLGAFNKLTNLVMDRNNLKFVSDQSASAARKITRLSLRNSGITRIPGALQNITDLESLDLSYNNIHSIERKDLQFLSHLKTLKLNNNPIIYVSGDTFIHNGRLTNLELRHSNLTRVPCAIKRMITVSSPDPLATRSLLVDLSNNAVECNCGLQWIHETLNNNPQTSLQVLGDCSTIVKSVQDYIVEDLPDCPTGAVCYQLIE